MALSVFAGHIVDHSDRKQVLLVSLLCNALIAAGLAWNAARHGSVVMIYLLLLLTSVAKAFQNPAKSTLVPKIVPRAIFGNAVSWVRCGNYPVRPFRKLLVLASPARAGRSL